MSNEGTAVTPPPPPAGAEWLGEWDPRHHDRVYLFPAIQIDQTFLFLTGVQTTDGRTATSIGVRFSDSPPRTVALDLMPEQARQLARALIAQADAAERVDGIGRDRQSPG
jgi:hypothetical protein